MFNCNVRINNIYVNIEPFSLNISSLTDNLKDIDLCLIDSLDTCNNISDWFKSNGRNDVTIDVDGKLITILENASIKGCEKYIYENMECYKICFSGTNVNNIGY